MLMKPRKGGALLVENQSNITLKHCEFHRNTVPNALGSGGGAIYAQNYSSITMQHFIFRNNTTGRVSQKKRIVFLYQTEQVLLFVKQQVGVVGTIRVNRNFFFYYYERG
jgi:predicted outer membrane repeat protein